MKSLKRVRMYRLIVLVILVFIILFTAIGFYTMAKTTYNFNSNFSDVSALEHMKYSTNGDDFYNFDSLESLDGTLSKNDLIIRGTINTENFINPVFVIRTNSNYYDAYVDGENILSKEKENIFNNFISIDFTPIPESYNGKTVDIFLFSNNPDNICKDVQIYTTNKYYLITQLFIGGISNAAFCLFGFISGIVLLLSYSSTRYRRYGLYVIGYLMILVSIMCLLSFNEFIILVVNNLYLISIMCIISMCQIPICILLFMQRYDAPLKRVKTHKMILNIYVVFLVMLLALNTLDVVSTQILILLVAISMTFITILSLFILIKGIINNVRNKVNLNTVSKNNQHFDSIIFEKYMPILFSIFLIVNIVSILLYGISRNSSMYIIPVSIAVTIIVLVLSTVFAFDLRIVNHIATVNQEIRLLNKNRVDLLLKKQMQLFNSNSTEDVCDKFINGLKLAIFPYKVNGKNEFEIYTTSVREKYVKDYNVFISSSSLVCIKKDKINDGDAEYEVLVGTGQFEGYTSVKYVRAQNFAQFEKIDAIMNQNIKFSDNDVVSFIGKNQNIKGIVLIRDLNGIEPIIKSLLNLYVKTCAMIIENNINLATTKNNLKDILFDLNELCELRLQQKGNHIKRICMYSALLAEKLKMSKKDIEKIKLATSMHDIGKIAISDKILNKPEKLTPEEFDIIKSHSEIGYDSFTNVTNDIISSAANIAKYHHEKYNGLGYFGLKGENIPIEARIVAICDVFDALSVKKIYKEPWNIKKINELLKKEKGNHFDPQITQILLDNMDEFLAIRDNYSESYEF